MACESYVYRFGFRRFHPDGQSGEYDQNTFHLRSKALKSCTSLKKICVRLAIERYVTRMFCMYVRKELYVYTGPR